MPRFSIGVIRVPPVEGRITHEGELVIVIGAIAKRVKPEDWKDVVFGYTIGNDVSARDVLLAGASTVRFLSSSSPAAIVRCMRKSLSRARCTMPRRSAMLDR